MTTDIERFEFPATGQSVRTVDVSGEMMFVAADVCAILGHTEAANIVKSRLDPDEFVTVEVPETDISTTKRTPNPLRIVVSESGLYSLILWSRKPEAKAFRKWVTSEVLPAIRQTGSYSVRHQIPTSFAEALELAAAQARELEAAEAHIAEIAPAAQSWNVLASGDGDYSVGDAAKILSRDPAINVGERRLFTVLHEHGWTYRQKGDQKWRAYQKAIDAGRLSEIPQSHYHPRTGELVLDPPQVRVLPKGVNDLRLILGGSVPLAVTESEGK